VRDRFGGQQPGIKTGPPRRPVDGLLQRLSARVLSKIRGVSISPDSKVPSFPLAAVTADADMQCFLEALDWFIQEVKAS
jgi:hypothetical protein